MSKSIAIDGPAGAGKSTIAKKVSASLEFIYLDTGAMYRAVALKAIKSGVDTTNQQAVSKIAENIDINITHDNNVQRIFLDGQDVSDSIRTSEISVGASNVAVFPEVRLKVVELQRKTASQYDVVMDGRDIGTYVLPKANLKVFLTASIDERAKRRYNELIEKGQQTTFEAVRDDMIYRDNNDSSRAFAPLKKAEDAIEVDTTALTIDEVAEKILYLFEYYSH